MAQLKHSPQDILSRLLIAKAAGSQPGAGAAWPIHVGVEPDSPQNVITVRGTAGVGAGRQMHDGAKKQHYGVLLRIRSGSQQPGYEKAAALVQVLTEEVYQETVTIDGDSYFVQCVSQVSEPIDLPKEPTSSRIIHTVNALLTVRALT